MKTKLPRPSGIKKKLLKDVVCTMILINIALSAVALLKDVLLASYLGTSAQADAFLLAYFLPDMAGNNLLASSLGVACIPVFSKIFMANDHDRQASVFSKVTIYSVFVSLLLLAVSFLAKDLIIGGIGAGFNEGTSKLCVRLFTIMLPILVVFPLIAIGTAVMQVNNRFNLPAMSPVLLNLVILAATIYVYLFSVPLRTGVYLLAVSVVCGVIFMWALIWLNIGKYRKRWLVRLPLSELIRPSGDLMAVLKTFLPYLLILLSSQIVFTVERRIASNLEVGAIAGLNYAFRLAQFPLWVFVAALSAVVFPSLSRAAGPVISDKFKVIMVNSLRIIFVITLPLTIFLFILRVPIISILLLRGSFDFHSLQITSGILAGYSLTIISQGVSIICTRAFLALGLIYIPLFAALISSGINILFDFFLAGTVGSAGLGYGAAIGALVNSAILYCIIIKFIRMNSYRLLIDFIKISGANIPIYAVAVFFNKLWYFSVLHSGLAVRAGYVIVIIAVSLPVYLIGMKLVKVPILAQEGINHA